MQIRDGIKTITTAGTRERLVAASTPALWLKIQNNMGSTGDVTVGNNTVVGAVATRRGILLSPTTESTVETKVPTHIDGPIDLYDIWVDCTIDGDKCHFIYGEP